MTDFIFLDSKITADSDWSHEIKRRLSSWNKSFDKPRQHIKKQTLFCGQKIHIIEAMIFPYHIQLCMDVSWTMKKAEHRIDAFELWCWRRLHWVPWTARSNQSILKEINPEYSLEGLMLKLKLQYFGHLMQRAASLKKTLMCSQEKGSREKEMVRWKHWTQWTWVWANSRGCLVCCSPRGWRVKNPSSSNLWTLLPVLNHAGFAP